MHRFIDGDDRIQPALLPHNLEDYVDEENPVRVIEVFHRRVSTLPPWGFRGRRQQRQDGPATILRHC